ncbi:hypothetical protein IOD13_18840 [Brevibacterium casei]|nr:hypothetical protein [Brevibacterium casei]
MELLSVGKRIKEPNGETRVLFDDLDFRLGRPPSAVAIMGRSGSGKTSLAAHHRGSRHGVYGNIHVRG